MNSSIRSVRPGRDRWYLASGDISSGWSQMNVGLARSQGKPNLTSWNRAGTQHKCECEEWGGARTSQSLTRGSGRPACPACASPIAARGSSPIRRRTGRPSHSCRHGHTAHRSQTHARTSFSLQTLSRNERLPHHTTHKPSSSTVGLTPARDTTTRGERQVYHRTCQGTCGCS